MNTALPKWISRVGDRGLDLLFPPSCVGCSAELDEYGDGVQLCRECRPCVVSTCPTVCPRCAAIVPDYWPTAEFCPHCEGEDLRFDATLALGPYEGLLRDLVLRMKNDRSERLGKIFARLMLQQWEDVFKKLSIDALVPVPMTRIRRLLRGTNPPEVISRHLASSKGWKHLPGLLTRRRNSQPQHGLSRPGRFRNIRGSIGCSRSYALEGSHVLLIDDVLTTGATCSEAARILKKQGAAHVTVVVAARTGES